MIPDGLSQTLQKGFHLTLGAGAALLEAIQSPQQASQRFAGLGNDVTRITAELETKGVATEREARQMVDTLVSQLPFSFPQSSSGASPSTVDTVARPVTDTGIQDDLASLRQALTEIRQELDALRDRPNQG
jgi:hypothetical protein